MPSSLAPRIPAVLAACLLGAPPVRAAPRPASPPGAEPAAATDRGAPAEPAAEADGRTHTGPDAAEPTSLRGLYARGEAAFEAGDLDAAVRAFEAGLSRAEDDPDASDVVRASFRVSLGIALFERWRKGPQGPGPDLDAAHRHLSYAVEHEGAALSARPTLEALARRNLDLVERARAKIRPPPPPRVVRVVEPGVDAALLARARKDRRAGVGLLVAGTVAVVGGLAILVDGLTLEKRARAIAEDPPMGRQKEYLEREVPRLQRIRYAIAGPALAVGAALVGAGIGLLVRARARARAATGRRR